MMQDVLKQPTDIILHKLRSKYMREHQVESHLLCYEPLFNASKSKNYTPQGSYKKDTHDVIP